MRSESAIQTAVIKKIKEKYGCNAKVYKIHDLCTVGIPDLLICLFGRFIAIELKKDSSCKATEKQMYELAQIRKAGGLAGVMSSVDEVMMHLEKTKGVCCGAGNH
jgi:hypothetical protein